MSSFGGQRSDSIRRNFAPRAPESQRGERLDIAALSYVGPAYSKGAEMADTLAASLGLGARVLGQTAEMAIAERRERERLDSKSQVLHDGIAAQSASRELPTILEEIRTGKLQAPAGVSREEFVREFLESRLGDDEPEAVRSGYVDRLYSPVLRELQNVDRAERERFVEETMQTLRDGAYGRTAADLAEAVKYANETLGVPAEEARRQLGLSAMELAARSGDIRGFAEGQAFLGESYLSEQQRALDVLEATQRAMRRDEQATAEDGIFASLNRGKPLPDVLADIDGLREAGVSEQRVGELRGQVVARVHRENVQRIRARILNDLIEPAEVEARVKEAALLSPTDPNFIDPATGDSLIQEANRGEKFRLADAQVRFVLSGGHGVLTESQHGAAFEKEVGPEGAGFIDGANRIARPVELGASILGARLAPTPIRQTLVASLTSSDQTDAANAALVVGMIGQASPRLFAQLLDTATPAERPILDAALDLYKRGRMFGGDSSGLTQAAAGIVGADAAGRIGAGVQAAGIVSALKAAATKVQSVPEPDAKTVADIERTEKLDRVVSSVLNAARVKQPHAVDTFLGFDWLNPDPSMGMPEFNIERRVRGWFADRFVQLRHLPRGQQVAKAREYALAQVENSVDFVRWGDDLQPVLIDTGEGLRLPDYLRWGDGFEAEARKDLAELGHDPESVIALRPFLTPAVGAGEDPEPRLGWVFVTFDGDDVRCDDGRVLVWRPSPELLDVSAKQRAMLEERDIARAASVDRHLQIMSEARKADAERRRERFIEEHSPSRLP